VGVEEHLGQTVPLDIKLTDSTGKVHVLRDLIDKPVILSPVYYSCKDMCPAILAGEARVIGELGLTPGKDYTLITFSFDELDTPQDAAHSKGNYLSATGIADFPDNEWRFMVTDPSSLKQLMDSIGMRVIRTEHGFSHVGVLIMLSPKGKIVRYIYGTSFLPFDIRLALAEAEEEKVGFSARRALLYCFSYDPEGRKYVFNVIRVAGTLTTLSGIIFFIYLVRSSKKRRKEMGYTGYDNE
jgi:protein SCO1/2